MAQTLKREGIGSLTLSLLRSGRNRSHTEGARRLSYLYIPRVATIRPRSGVDEANVAVFIVNTDIGDGGAGTKHDVSPLLVTRSNLAHPFTVVTVRYGWQRVRGKGYVQLWGG